MKIDALTHPKTIDFAANLGVCLPQAIGHLELLWVFVGQKTPRGNIGRWSNAVIAHHAQWVGSPDDFVNALITSGFVDEDDEYRLLIHDWEDHIPRWVRAKLSKEGEEIISRDGSKDCSSDDSEDDSEDSSEDSSGDSVRVRKGKEVKGKAEKKKREPKKRGSRLPADWKPDDELLAWAMTERQDLDMQRVIDSFTDYWRAATGKNATKLDWNATFRNWVRNEKRPYQNGNGTDGTRKPSVRETPAERRDRECREALEAAGYSG